MVNYDSPCIEDPGGDHRFARTVEGAGQIVLSVSSGLNKIIELNHDNIGKIISELKNEERTQQNS